MNSTFVAAKPGERGPNGGPLSSRGCYQFVGWSVYENGKRVPHFKNLTPPKPEHVEFSRLRKAWESMNNLTPKAAAKAFGEMFRRNKGTRLIEDGTRILKHELAAKGANVPEIIRLEQPPGSPLFGAKKPAEATKTNFAHVHDLALRAQLDRLHPNGLPKASAPAPAPKPKPTRAEALAAIMADPKLTLTEKCLAAKKL